MIKEIIRGVGLAKIISGLSNIGLCGMETLTDCNRAGRCLYCNVTGRWDRAKASTVDDGCRQIKWARDEGSKGINIAGGETLVRAGRFITKEDISFADHNLRLTRYAHELGMFTVLTTNGDTVVPPYDIVRDLKKAGLDVLTYTLHNPEDEISVKKTIDKAKITARLGIPPVVSTVFTAERASLIPNIARECAVNGIPFGATIVQEIGKGYSAIPAKSQIPTVGQKRAVFGSLHFLKMAGLITNSWKYLTEAPNYTDNSWKCNPGKDAFVHIRSQEEDGEIGVCSEVRTGFRTGEVHLKSEQWRNRKLDLVDMALLGSAIFSTTDPMVMIGFKLAANAATHMAWDFGNMAVNRIRNFRPTAII